MSRLKDAWSATRTYLSRLGRNRYFWGGLAVLALLIFGLYFLVNDVMMPSLTRQGVSVNVPNVLNLPVDQAEAELRAADLEVEKIVQRYNPNFPRDVVIDQNPAPEASVKPGRQIYVTVNSGELRRVAVPDLEDLSLREAINRLRARGLQVAETLPDSIPAPNRNTVTRQEPAPGDSVTEGSSVTLWYSTGLGEQYTTIPEVTELTFEEAQRALLDAQLRSIIIGAEPGQDVAEEQVARQSPQPGTRVRAGFEVRLYVGREEEEPPPAEGI